MNFPFTLSITFRRHLLIGLIGGVWITLFLIFVGPFDTATLTLEWRAKVMAGYGLIFFISYALGFLIYGRIYTKIKEKQILPEILTYTLIFTLILVESFLYYTSETINGDYNFYEFLTRIYLPTLLIFIPLLLLARWVVFYFYDRNTANSAKKILNKEADVEAWMPKIQQLMEEKIYLNPALTLQKMSQLLSTNSAVLSQAINQGYGNNFNDFINKYRVEEVMQCIKKGQYKTHTITGIAQNCGFNARATFNRAFKKHLHIAPGEYIRQIQEMESTKLVSNDNSRHTSF